MLIVQKLHDYAGIGEWVKLDLQSIQHRDYFGHLSIFFKFQKPFIISLNNLEQFRVLSQITNIQIHLI